MLPNIHKRITSQGYSEIVDITSHRQNVPFEAIMPDKRMEGPDRIRQVEEAGWTQR
jgi:hypothetical protein